MIYNIILESGIQQSDSVLYIYIYIYVYSFSAFFPLQVIARLYIIGLQGITLLITNSLLYYTVGPGYLSILHIVVYTC